MVSQYSQQKTRTTDVAILDNAFFHQLEVLRDAAAMYVAQIVKVFVIDFDPF